jgi:beta-lactamase class D
MKNVYLLFLGLIFASPILSKPNPAELFKGKDGCFLLAELESGKVVQEFNPGVCKERLSPCSTFKVPLAVMAFDSKVLKDENTKFKWDGKLREREALNHDHTARSWLEDSVVWFSQRLTPEIGETQIKRYLKDFSYGNEDFSGGITQAWLGSSLKISAKEQIEFLRRLKLGKLNVAKESVVKTLGILPIALDRNGTMIKGKTGSGFSWEDPNAKKETPYVIGWYVGYYTEGKKDYVFATVFKEKSPDKKIVYSGKTAKAITTQLLETK